MAHKMLHEQTHYWVMTVTFGRRYSGTTPVLPHDDYRTVQDNLDKS